MDHLSLVCLPCNPEHAPNGPLSASVIYLRPSWVSKTVPYIVSSPDPCCDPNDANLEELLVGPRSNSLREFELIQFLGGQRSR